MKVENIGLTDLGESRPGVDRAKLPIGRAVLFRAIKIYIKYYSNL